MLHIRGEWGFETHALAGLWMIEFESGGVQGLSTQYDFRVGIQWRQPAHVTALQLTSRYVGVASIQTIA